MSKHTPGPWWVNWAVEDAWVMDAGKPSTGIVRVFFGDGDQVEGRANARLIAKAPEMLELLKGYDMDKYGSEITELLRYIEEGE